MLNIRTDSVSNSSVQYDCHLIVMNVCFSFLCFSCLTFNIDLSLSFFISQCVCVRGGYLIAPPFFFPFFCFCFFFMNSKSGEFSPVPNWFSLRLKVCGDFLERRTRIQPKLKTHSNVHELSNVEPGHYLDGWPLVNTIAANLNATVVSWITARNCKSEIGVPIPVTFVIFTYAKRKNMHTALLSQLCIN